MNYSKIQKTIASIIIPFFFFSMVFNFPINVFNSSNAGETKLYSLVSILVNNEIYNDVKNSVETYAEDISKQLENTKVVIIPTPKNTDSFNIASLLENLYYEGYKGVNQDIDFKSKLVGTVLVGDFPIPTVYKQKEYSTTILPYVDFEDKSYIYNHKTKKYEKNSNNIEGIKPEIWHGIINPNTGNKQKNIEKINDYFEKNHNFYEGTGNFKKENGIINGKVNEENPEKYEPYVFYFDQIREQQSIKYASYIGYEAYLENKEDMVYSRYSTEFAKKIQGDVLDFPNKEIENLMSQIPGSPEIKDNSPDLTRSSDIMTKAIIDKASKKFIEVLNSSKIGEFRKDVNNSGRYSGKGNKINIDMIPYLISVLDEIGDQTIKGANQIIENRINKLVIEEGLSRNIALPTKIIEDPDIAGTLLCNKEYTNILNGKLAKNIKQASECSIYIGTNSNNGKLVEANRGINILNFEDDVNWCKNRKTTGYWGGNSPINLNENKLSSGIFELENNSFTGSIRPIFDIAGSKYEANNSNTPSPLKCLNNNYIYSKQVENVGTPICEKFLLPIDGIEDTNSHTCRSIQKQKIFSLSFTQNYKEHKEENCKKREIYLDDRYIITGKLEEIKEGQILACPGLDTKYKYKYKYKTIPSYVKHISPTFEELKIQITNKATPNLGLDKNRYIDFISAIGNLEKINYLYLFRLTEDLSQISSLDEKINKISQQLDRALDIKTEEIREKIKNNDPSKLIGVDLEIYNLLKINDYPISDNFDLKEFIKNQPGNTISIFGEDKELSYYDNLVFSIFWNSLSNVGQKYKFIFENYLNDQTSSKFKHFLPKNKKIYEIAYLGAPGNAQNMYIGINPEEKGENPYADLDTKNSLLEAEVFSSGVKSSIINSNFEESKKDNKKNIFKCAPPEGVSIIDWPDAIKCRIDDLEPKINFDNSRCSSETLFEGQFNPNDWSEGVIYNNGTDSVDKNNVLNNGIQDEEPTCRNDLNKNGVEDCLEDDIKDAKIEIISSSKKVHTNSQVLLELKVTNKKGKILNKINNLSTKFEIVRIIDKKTNKVVNKKDYDKYIIFNEKIIPTRRGKSKFSFNSKNKEAEYTFIATAFLTGKNKKEIINITSNTIDVKVSNDLFSSTINKISNDNILNNGENEILASDKNNIYLLDSYKNKLDEKTLKKIKNSSSSKEKVIISLNQYANGNKKIPLNYPLKLYLTRNGEKVIDNFNITENNLSDAYPVYSLTKKGEYKLKITDNQGQTTTKIFNIIPEIANKIDINLSTNILEKNGNITSNVFILKDKYGNISDGYNHKVYLKSEGNFSFPLNDGENLSQKELNVYYGYKGFRLKANDKNGSGKIKIIVKYNDKIVATNSKTIQTIEKININLTKPEKIKVGGDIVKFELDFKDNQGNLLKNLNSRVYLSINKIYGITEKPYFEVKNGKATIIFKTSNLSGENIPIEFKMEGLREIIKENISIEPEKAIKLDFNISKKIAKSSPDEKITVKVQLKDRYNNTVYTDNTTRLDFEIKDKYKNILKLNGPSFKISQKGETIFNLKATSEPGLAYFKISTSPDLSDNSFESNGKTIYGVGEKAGQIRTYYFWDKESFKNKKYNALYTVMLGADYGNIREKDYLAGSIIFDKNNRSLAVTSLVNNPYEFSNLIAVYNNGKIKDISSQNDITQDLELTTSINEDNKLYVNVYNKILNNQIGKINYTFGNGAKLLICETTVGECGISEKENSINLKSLDNNYLISKENDSLFIKNNGLNILEINNKGEFISNSLLKFEIDDKSKENFLIINIISNGSKIAQLIINISNDKENIDFELSNSTYNTRNIIIDGKLTRNIYYNNFFSTDGSISNFSSTRDDDIENFRKKQSIGWKGENKFLLDFAAGKKVGESIMDKQSFGIITLGDPVISLKPIQTTFNDGTTKKSFNATIGKKISKDGNIKSYQIFDYDNDKKDDILLIKNDGYLKLLENKANSKTFLDKGNIAFISDKGNPKFIKTGDFTGDGYDDIFFVNNKEKPQLLNNNKKDFVRIDLEKQFKLKGKIIQVETFDMDNDGTNDIITLDDSGEINIFYGGGTNKSPKFTKKIVGKGNGLKLNSTPKNNGVLVNFDGLYQISDEQNTYTDGINKVFLNRQIFVQINDKADIETGLSNKKTFIKSEYSESSGIKIEKVFKDLNGGTLSSGDEVEVELKIINTSNSIKRNIKILDNIEKPFFKTNEEIDYKKLGFSQPIAGYDFYIKDFTLVPGASKIIKYKLKTPTLSYGNIKVGLFEKGEVGDDKFGDIIIKKDNKNCSDNSKIYKSISKRSYSDLKEKGLTCDENKIKLPDAIEEAKKINIDNDNNGIPDYIDELKNNPEKSTDYAKKEKETLDEEDSRSVQDKLIKSLNKINKQIDQGVEGIDNLIDSYNCGFSGGGCIATPLNWAPLAPGNDPTLFGTPMGDGLKVGEGIPILSISTKSFPYIWPPNPSGAGGYFGTNYSGNQFRMFVTPTLTGGIGTAICFGGPPSIMGNSIPEGTSPIVPGGNCIVAAKPLLSCSNDGSEGDPSSIGQVDILGGGNSLNGNSNNSFGIINGNCSVIDKNNGKIINKSFIKKYYQKLEENSNNFNETFKKEYERVIKQFGNNTTSGRIGETPLFNLNGEGIGEESLNVSALTSYGLDGRDIDFEDVIQIKKDRVSAFPSFLMDWVTRQIEEVVTKLADFPTIYLILPDFSGILDNDWIEHGKKSKEQYSKAVKKQEEANKSVNEKIKNLKKEKNKLKCDGDDKLKCYNINYKIGILEAQKIGNFGKGQDSGIKAAYEFLANVPLINLEPQQINIDIPFPDTNTLDKFIIDSKSTLEQWKNEVNLGKINGSANSDIQNLISNLEENIEIAEEYKQFPRKLTKLLNQKEIWINQVMCSVEEISEITSGWIGRNGIRFKAWVETFILIKSILKSWQLLIDLFTDYEAECQECKNERQDSLDYEFKLISMILPKFPVIQFPKWPDIILDLHNIRAGINLKIPDVVINQRPLVLPNFPDLTLPEANVNADLDVPEMPLLTRYEFSEITDLPTLPHIELPDLPPPPQLPKIFSELEGVLKILKLITKAMCLLKQLPFVPEWRAGDQIAFLTERNGYLPTDFIDLSLPQFSVPYLDAIKVTTFVNLETDSTFLVETLRDIISPLNDTTNNWANKFSNAGLDNLDYSNKSINKDIKTKIDKNGKIKTKNTGFSESIYKKIINLISYIDKNKDEKVNNKEFIYLINKSLASSTFRENSRTKEIIKLWDEVNNYNFNKENKLISELKQNNKEKFDNLDKILENELRKTKQLKKDLKNLQNKPQDLFLKVSSKSQNKDFVEYKKSLKKYNDNFKKSAINLINGKKDYQVEEIKKQGKKLLTRINGGLNNFNKNILNKDIKNNKLLAINPSSSSNIPQNSCQQSQNSDYSYNYKGLYIIEKNKSYRLFNYMDELNGDETYSSIDFDQDGDQDLVYMVNGNLYLKENLNVSKAKSGVEPPLELKISENKYFNGKNFVEAINNFKEINTDNGFVNISFKSPTDKSINHFRVEYYTIVDKFLNEEKIDNIKKNVIDALVEDKFESYEDNLIKKHSSYINYIGDVPAVIYYTYEMKDITSSIINNNKINLSATTPLYTGNDEAKIKYYYETDKKNILEKTIPENSSIRFKEKIIIIGINGKLYSKTNKKISLVGNDIRKYIGLPLFEESEFSIIPDLKSKMIPNLSNIEIKHSSGTDKLLDFNNIDYYSYYNLGKISEDYLIRIPVENDYYYSKIYAIKGNIRGTYSAQKLFAPQLASDNNAPEIEGLSKIRIPVYQEYKQNLKGYIFEKSGLRGIKDIKLKVQENSNILPDNYKINKNLSDLSIEFNKFNKLFKEKIEIILEDNNGNISSTPIDFEVYSPNPEINKNEGNKITGKIDENLIDEPINIYRIRSGGIKRLETKNNKIKVDTVDEGLYTFDARGDNSKGLILKNNNEEIATINENTGKITILNTTYKIKVESDNSLFPQIVIEDSSGKKIYSQFLKLEQNIETIKVESFENVEENGLYLKIANSNYDSYTIPNGAKTSAGISAIYRKNDNSKKALFTITPDGRIKYNARYYINYNNTGENIILELKSRNGNKKIAELLFKINGTYLMN